MKRFRLSTLLLLVVIAALSLALVVQQRRAARREDEIHFRYAVMEHLSKTPLVFEMEGQHILQLETDDLQALADRFAATKEADR